MTKKILIVEDDQPIIELLEFNIVKAGYDVTVAVDGREAMEKLAESKFDLVILDLMLPEVDGLEVCKFIRQRYNYTVYIIMLTARSEEIDRIVGLEVGADDYITKPFSPRELVSRIKATFRRDQYVTTDAALVVRGDLRINKEQYTVNFMGHSLELTPKQFGLLLYLAENPGKVCSRDELLTAVWGYDFFGDSRTVDVHISQLRHIFAAVAGEGAVPIQTLRGIGYRLRGDQ
ncbi:MAG: response regulator transcription factor [Firmicutes bacterium]|nr:response regulator transcription factor [Bacillota bacterium]